jgi:Membrane proteins related to metalloendopeptidases
MRKSLFSCFIALFPIVLIGLNLTACGQVIVKTLGSPTLISTNAIALIGSQPTQTPFLPAILTPPSMDKVTPVKTFLQPIISTGTPNEISTNAPTETPTETAISFIYFFPVQPPILASFAEGLASHGYPATDIFAPEGTKFVAVIGGVVDFVSYQDTWDPQTDDPTTRGGLSVAIIGDDGMRYYGSHLSKIQAGIGPGVRLAAGAVLGYIGHTGDARNTDSHLHFGISHPSYPEDWKARRGQVDPYAYLFAWRSGLNLTPALSAP